MGMLIEKEWPEAGSPRSNPLSNVARFVAEEIRSSGE